MRGTRILLSLLALLLTCTEDSAVSFLAGSKELVLSAVSSSFITFLLLGLLGALLVCTYIKRPMRPPSVLVRESDAWHLLPLVRGCRLGELLGQADERQG